MRPNRLIVRAYLSRGAYLWLGTRAIATGIFAYFSVDPIRLPVASIVQLVLVTVVICFLDTRRRREWAMLGNLGLRSGSLALLFAAPATVGELVIRILGAVV